MTTGDRVRLVRPVRNVAWNGREPAPGATGRVGVNWRDDFWAMWLDEAVAGKRLLGVTSDDVEVIR